MDDLKHKDTKFDKAVRAGNSRFSYIIKRNISVEKKNLNFLFRFTGKICPDNFGKRSEKENS